MTTKNKTTTPPIRIGVRRFRDGAELPTYGTKYAAGMDIYAWIKDQQITAAGTIDTITYQSIPPGAMATINTGLNVRIPEGYEIQVRSRSGLSAKHQIVVLNSPGTIDADYDGDGEEFELRVLLYNHSHKSFVVNHGDRIAQLVVAPIVQTVIDEEFGPNDNRLDSARDGGFGSTGVQ